MGSNENVSVDLTRLAWCDVVGCRIKILYSNILILYFIFIMRSSWHANTSAQSEMRAKCDKSQFATRIITKEMTKGKTPESVTCKFELIRNLFSDGWIEQSSKSSMLNSSLSATWNENSHKLWCSRWEILDGNWSMRCECLLRGYSIAEQSIPNRTKKRVRLLERNNKNICLRRMAVGIAAAPVYICE